MDHLPADPLHSTARCTSDPWCCDCWFAWADKKEKRDPPKKPVLRVVGREQGGGALGSALKKHFTPEDQEEKVRKKTRDKDKPSRFGSRRR